MGVCVSKPDEGASATMQCIVKPTLRTQSPTQRRLTVSALPRLANLGHAVPPAAELPGANPVPALRACNCGSTAKNRNGREELQLLFQPRRTTKDHEEKQRHYVGRFAVYVFVRGSGPNRTQG